MGVRPPFKKKQKNYKIYMLQVRNRYISAFHNYFMFFSKKKVQNIFRLAMLGKTFDSMPLLTNILETPLKYKMKLGQNVHWVTLLLNGDKMVNKYHYQQKP